MKSNALVYPIYLACCAALAFYFLFTSSRESAGHSDADLIGAVLAGRAGADSGGEEDGPESIFDTPFYSSAQLSRPIAEEEGELPDNGEEPEILDPANPDNPVNPMTGQRFPDSAMRVFDRLRDRFPTNSLLPRRQSAAERQAEDTERLRVMSLQSSIATGQASRDQVNEFYDFQAKSWRDRLELIEFVVGEKGDAMSPEIRQQYDRVRSMSDEQVKALEAQRQAALSRAH
ncbi:MAG: hypothetical protein K1X75_16780 [Leptospirales bacterium]|nr:hypothetical protein [Leptospirales bacterium]